MRLIQVRYIVSKDALALVYDDDEAPEGWRVVTIAPAPEPEAVTRVVRAMLESWSNTDAGGIDELFAQYHPEKDPRRGA